MKKSFCDICGEEANFIFHESHPIKSVKLLIMPAWAQPIYKEGFRDHEPADLCKKCARELLDKIEL